MGNEEGSQTQPHISINDDREAHKLRRKGGWVTFPFILGSTFGLSVAFTGASSNMVVHLIKKYNVRSIDAAQIGNIINVCTSLSSVAGAIISDAFLGCYPVVAASALISFLLCGTEENAVSLVVLFAGARYCRRPSAQGSPFTVLARVAVAAAKKWNVKVPQENPSYYYGAGGSDQKPPSQNLGRSRLKSQDFVSKMVERLRFLNRAALICHGETRADGSLARPWSLCKVQEVDDFKSLLRIAPLLSASVFVSISIGIHLGLTVLQALTMDRSLGRHFLIPASSFMVASLAATVVALSLLDRLLVPLWGLLTLGRTPTPLQRIGLGHVLNMAAMAASALVERRRAAVVLSHHAESQAAWAVTGVGEALHLPGQVALYYQEFPKPLKNTATAMTAVNIGLGFDLSTAIVDLIRRSTGWLPDNINASRLENVYWLVTASALVNFVYYLVWAMLYKYQGAPEPGEAHGHHGH